MTRNNHDSGGRYGLESDYWRRSKPAFSAPPLRFNLPRLCGRGRSFLVRPNERNYVEKPIQVMVLSAQIGGTMAFSASAPTKNAKDYTRDKAIVAALLAAGLIEIIDLDAPRPVIKDDGSPV